MSPVTTRAQAESQSNRAPNFTTLPLQIYTAGFNAFGQLTYYPDTSDIKRFTRLLPDGVPVFPTEVHARLLHVGWSSTAWVIGGQLMEWSNRSFTDRLASASLAAGLHNGFGDHDGFIGCLDSSGKLHTLYRQDGITNGTLVCHGTSDTPVLAHVALAGNEKVATTFKQAPGSQMCHIMQFDSDFDFAEWFCDPSLEETVLEGEKVHFMLPGRVAQLAAGTGMFLCLMEGGEVYSWGDPRFLSLGRGIVGEEDTAAEKPGLVEALAGLKIRKVACGGWMCAALSEDGALYIWGAATGNEELIHALGKADAGDVVLVNIPGGAGEPLDILDVGVGDNHIAVIAEDKTLYVIGDNRNGQLGLGSAWTFASQWTQVPALRNVQHVLCAPKATFIYLQPRS